MKNKGILKRSSMTKAGINPSPPITPRPTQRSVGHCRPSGESALESADLARAWLQRAQRAEVQVLGLRAFLNDLKADIEIMRISPPSEIEQMEFLDDIPEKIDKLLAGDTSAAENEEKSA